ncbi:MAG: hypothetical protein AAFU41_13975 [Pseudomonadota bacterium]
MAELSCVWLTQCYEDGTCEVIGSPDDEPGHFIYRGRNFDDLLRVEHTTGTFIIEDDQTDGDAKIFDVTFMYKADETLVFFGQKDNRSEMLSIAPDGNALLTAHYPGQHAAIYNTGICTGDY